MDGTVQLTAFRNGEGSPKQGKPEPRTMEARESERCIVVMMAGNGRQLDP